MCKLPSEGFQSLGARAVLTEMAINRAFSTYADFQIKRLLSDYSELVMQKLGKVGQYKLVLG